MKHALVAALVGAALFIPAALAAPAPGYPLAQDVSRATIGYENAWLGKFTPPAPYRVGRMTCVTASVIPGIYYCSSRLIRTADGAVIGRNYEIFEVKTTKVAAGHFHFTVQGPYGCPTTTLDMMRCSIDDISPLSQPGQ